MNKFHDDVLPITEWVIWANLDKNTDLEIILLKGHLLLELILNITLTKVNCQSWEDYSFSKKITLLSETKTKENERKLFIIQSLKDLNKLRNKLAHEFHFEVTNGHFEIWALNILKNLDGTKFSNYTFRTKIVHAFSVLSLNILKLI